MEATRTKTCFLVCGGGNAAHCLVASIVSTGMYDVNVLSLFSNEAETWNSILPFKQLNVYLPPNSETKVLSGSPKVVTSNPEIAMKSVRMIFLAVPANTHGQYLKALAPLIKPNSLLLGLPGQAGFEFQCRHLLKNSTKTMTLLSFESLPWACRILEFGKSAQVLGTKKTLFGFVSVGLECKLGFDYMEVLRRIFGKEPELRLTKNNLAITLMAKSILHPPIMFGKWRSWDRKPLDTVPLFYQGIDKLQADLLSAVSDEIAYIAREIQTQCSNVDMSAIVHVHDWYKTTYGEQITDDSTLESAIKTNKAYDGLLHPMIECQDGFVPDFTHRYLTEDVPYGLVVIKGVGEIIGVQTPTIDLIVEWAQCIMKKEFIVDGKLIGKDVKCSRAPQAYNIHSLFDLLHI